VPETKQRLFSSTRLYANILQTRSSGHKEEEEEEEERRSAGGQAVGSNLKQQLATTS